MKRPITAFATDEAGDWVARLDCGHRQHVRHNPPFSERPWVLSEEGRAGKLGALLDCLRCEAQELPPTFVAYKRTDVFSESTVPAGLKKDHATKAGVWARIVVVEGRLRYRIDAWGREEELSSAAPGIVVPEVKHHVEPLGPVRFFVEFFHASEDLDA
jgi:tellurite methyltransferase